MNYRLMTYVPVAGLVLGWWAFHRPSSSSEPSSRIESPALAMIQEPLIPIASEVAANEPEPALAPAEQPAKRDSPLFNPHSLSNDHHLWMSAEALCGKAYLGSASYATRSDSTTSVQNGRVKSPDSEWKGGYRLGLGYKIPHDHWDLFAGYTYRYGSAHGHLSAPSEGAVFPLFATNFAAATPFYAASSSAHWHVHLNMADLELGRECQVSRFLSMRPFVGVRGGTISQRYQVSYRGGTVAPEDTDQLEMTSDFWGVGLRMGLNTTWGLGAGFSLYGNGSASMLSSHFDVHEREKLLHQALKKMDLDSHVNSVALEADLALGVQWDYLFSNDRYHVGVKFGWEFDVYFDQNQLFNFTSTSPGSFRTRTDDLSFQGLTLGFRFDF